MLFIKAIYQVIDTHNLPSKQHVKTKNSPVKLNLKINKYKGRAKLSSIISKLLSKNKATALLPETKQHATLGSKTT